MKIFDKIFKFQSIATYLIFLIGALILSCYFRLYPLLNYASSDSLQKAKILIVSKLQYQIENVINLKFPSLNKEQKEILKINRTNELIKNDRKKLQNEIEKLAKEIDQSDKQSRKYPYLLEADPYHFYNLTQRILEKGSISDSIKGSKYFNDLMLAPIGHWEPFSLHPYIGLYFYKIMAFFNKDIELMYAVSLIPLIISCISLIIYFLICSQLKIRPLFTFIGSTFFMLAPIFIKRSSFGWYDNDPYNILFPLLILFSLFSALKNFNNEQKTNFFNALILSIITLIYALLWQGWILMFCFIGISALCIIIFNNSLFKQKASNKSLFIYFLLFLIICFASIAITFGLKDFFILFKEGFKAFKNFIFPQLSVWPDLYISVGELHSATFNEILISLGGGFFFILACFGLISSIYLSIKNSNRFHPFITVSLGVLFCILLLLSVGAQRFILFGLIPISILFPIGLQNIFATFESILSKKIASDRIKNFIKLYLLVIFSSVIIIPIRNIHKELPSLLNPIYNDTWNRALTKIKEETSTDSIINGWWSPGHFVKAMAKRKVSFDGATINFPQAFWMSRVFLSQSEEEAIGILRMLNVSANKSSDYLESLGFSTAQSIQILRTITALDRLKAKMYLTTNLKNPTTENKLLEMTHGTPVESYLMIYKELIDKNLQFAFIGKWNYSAIERINKDKIKLKQVPSRKSKKYIEFLWNLAGGQYKYNPPLEQIAIDKNDLVFEDNIRVNLNSKDCFIASKRFGEGIPQSIFYQEGNSIVEKKFPFSNLQYSIVLFKDTDKYKIALMDGYLANSLLMKLYFFDGIGMKFFKPFIHESDLTQETDIQIFKIEWSTFIKNEI